MKRYQLVLLPCKDTSEDYWNRVISSADKLAEVFDTTQYGYLGHDQLWQVVDSKTGKIISSEEYRKIVRGK